jgi:cation transport regulator ChaB
MPYRSNSELPAAVKTALPEAAQTIWRKAFMSIYADDPEASEESMFKRAWGAVKNAGWKPGGEGKKWTHDSEPNERVSIDSSRILFDLAFADDQASLDARFQPRKTSEGYLVAFPRVARVGIQEYTGDETGRPEMDVVRVYRPENEVFAKDSLASYAHRPVTNDHPPVLVGPDNWKRYGAGQLGEDVLRDGDFVRVPLVLMDRAAIRDYENGKTQLSLGYTMDLVWGAGTTPSGETYDATMKRIRANHLALCDAARGGSALAIGDKGEQTMTLKTIVVDGLSVEVSDMAANVVTRQIDRLTADAAKLTQQLADADKARKDLEATSATQIAKDKTALEAKDAEIAALKKQLEDAKVSPAQLDQMVKDRAEVAAKAKAIIGDKLVIDGRSVTDIRRQVVDAKLGDAAKGWTDDQVLSAFASFAADTGRQIQQSNNLNGNNLVNVLSNPVNDAASDKAYSEYVTQLQDAYKKPYPTQ